ncbi:hypothetical protein IFM89_020115, partial [Coptis chinensis]
MKYKNMIVFRVLSWKKIYLSGKIIMCRIRPLSNYEISIQGNSKCVRHDSSRTITWSGPPESRFTFDHVADENVTQDCLWWRIEWVAITVAWLPMDKLLSTLPFVIALFFKDTGCFPFL